MARVIAKRALIAHPETPVRDYAVGAKVSRYGSDVLAIEYVITGRLSAILIPDPAAPDRTDELWKSTCFEAFTGRPAGPYTEFNFAPSRRWAIYRFEGYRSGMQPAMDLPAPATFPERTADTRFQLTAFVELGSLRVEGPTQLALSAVIEETDGRKSYWALAHPPGKPDFHHPDSFACELP